jgi:OPA family glycerol-3-phosphate transporter-like MFS transporter
VASFFAPPPPAPRLPPDEVKRLYPALRWQVLEATFIGYAFFYLVRNNFSPVAKELGAALHFSKPELGLISSASALAYGAGKFLLGAVSDRSDARRFMPLGLVISALLNFVFAGLSSFWSLLLVWVLNGFFQGMGWPPCGRALSHWYAPSERGRVFGVWNVAHNIGGALAGPLSALAASYLSWRGAFYVPGILSLGCAAYLFWRLRDTPQSVGLPPVEEYKNEVSAQTPHEAEMPFGALLRSVLSSGWIWFVALANFFAYVIRYSLLDWGPTYLKEARGASLLEGGYSTAVYELAGVASTIGLGWLTDRLGGRRGFLCFLCVLPIVFAFAGMVYTPNEYLGIVYVYFGIIGFAIYPLIMLYTVIGLDLSSKKAIGTAAGFIGLFGYLGRTVQGYGLGYLAEHYSWNAALSAVLVVIGLELLMTVILWRARPSH